MSDTSTGLLMEILSSDEGIPSLFKQWNENADFTYDLRFDKDDNMLIIVTDQSAQQIEVFKINVQRVI